MAHPQLAPGTLFANRFEIQCTAGRGGMGTVYRAFDRYTGDVIALKLLHSEGNEPGEADRFTREAQLLAELRHPAIVTYIAHGGTPDGQRFLAMEWLEGHDLGQRLARGPLWLHETMQVAQRTAEALTLPHRRGIVHRDLKPTNLFLPDGDVARCKLLDFGIARRTTKAITQTGRLVGTPEYMAPEQAAGSRDITPAADIFSLGCVLYECLTGEPPFVAEHMAAVLVRILFEDPAPLCTRRPGVPEPVVTLLGDMLHKSAGQRIADAATLLERLSRLGEIPELPVVPTLSATLPSRSVFAENEQALFSLVVASGPGPKLSTSPTLPASEAPADEGQRAELLLAAVRTLGVRAEYLINGTLVVTTPQTGSAQDQAVTAARVALLIKERWPEAMVTVSTGRGTARQATAVGEVADRAVQLLEKHANQEEAEPRAATSGVWLDALSARLLGSRFTLSHSTQGTLLLCEQKEADESRLLLGKPTPCLGRDTELLTLEAQLSGCIEESEARAMLITAPPGIGKSRLRHEFLRRIEQRSDPITVLSGRGEIMNAGAPYAILGSAIRRLCGLSGSEPLSEQLEVLRRRIALHVEAPEQDRVVWFVGELCGIKFPQQGKPLLQAARQDAKIMRDSLRRALLDWLLAECSAAPVLLVLDDLQWGDELTVTVLDEALRKQPDSPLLILAFARPEVHETFPKLWHSHKMHEIALKGLSRKSCERLAQQILGKKTSGAVIARIVEQSHGNALFLEELIRAAGEGEADAQVETVIAMLQARIGRFEPGARRAVRAASVFGQTFWSGGVAELLGLPRDDAQVEDWLAALVEAEVIEPHPDSRLAHTKEYGFRHALVREAAYSLLTQSDLTTGHRLAARYLTLMGEPEPLVLVDHYRRGGEPEHAVPLYLRAAEAASRVWALAETRQLYSQAKAALDELADTPEHRRLRVDILLKSVESGIMFDPAEQNFRRLAEARTVLATLSADGPPDPGDQRRGAWIDLFTGRTHYYQGHLSESIVYYKRMLPVGEALGDNELLVLSSQLVGSTLVMQGYAGQALSLLARAAELQNRPDTDYERLRTMGHYAGCLVMTGRYREGLALHDQLVARAVESKQPAGLVIVNIHRSSSLLVSSDYKALRENAQRALEYARNTRDHILIHLALSMLGWAHSSLGNPREALSYRREAQALEQEHGGRLLASDWFAALEAELALQAGDAERAVDLAQRLTPRFRQEQLPLALGCAEQAWGLALGRLAPSRPEQADEHLAAGLAVLESAQQVLLAAQLQLKWAQLCRHRGSVEQAAALHARAVAQFEAAGCAHVIEGVEKACLTWL